MKRNPSNSHFANSPVNSPFVAEIANTSQSPYGNQIEIEIKTDRTQKSPTHLSFGFTSQLPSDPKRSWNSPPKNYSSSSQISSAGPLFRRSPSFKGNKQLSPKAGQPKEQNLLSFHKPATNTHNPDNKNQELDELLISLKEIKRLRDVIQGLMRDNKRLKRMMCELLDGKFQGMDVQEAIQKYSDDVPEQRGSPNNSFRNTLNSQHLMSPRRKGSQDIQTVRHQNLKLVQEVALLKRNLQAVNASRTTLIRDNSALLETINDHQVTNNQLTVDNKRLEAQYFYCFNKTRQLELRISQFENQNQCSLTALNNSCLTIESKSFGVSLNESGISLVQHRVVNNGLQEGTRLDLMFPDRGVESPVESVISGSKISKGNESCNTKQSQTDFISGAVVKLDRRP